MQYYYFGFFWFGYTRVSLDVEDTSVKGFKYQLPESLAICFSYFKILMKLHAFLCD